MTLIEKLRSQIGDDIQHVFDHEVLSRLAAARIEELEAELANGSFYQEKDIDAMQNRIKELEAKLATAAGALEEAAKSLDAEADKCDDAIKWNVSARYKKDCEAASYAMRNMATAIRALKSTTQP